mgnify:CR=1 FL=1
MTVEMTVKPLKTKENTVTLKDKNKRGKRLNHADKRIETAAKRT